MKKHALELQVSNMLQPASPGMAHMFGISSEALAAHREQFVMERVRALLAEGGWHLSPEDDVWVLELVRALLVEQGRS